MCLDCFLCNAICMRGFPRSSCGTFPTFVAQSIDFRDIFNQARGMFVATVRVRFCAERRAVLRGFHSPGWKEFEL